MDLNRYPNTGRFLEGRLRHTMTDAEKRSVEQGIEKIAEFDTEKVLLHRGEIYNHSTMLIEGFALRAITVEGRRHIVSVHVPGDFIDLHAFPLKRLDHDIIVIGKTKVGYTPHDRLKQVLTEQPRLARLLWFSTLLDAAMHREWITKLGVLRVENRVAHVLAEIWARLEMVHLGLKDGFASPLRQEDLAAMCGSTAIHINRSLRNLREAGIADFRRGRAYIEDRERLWAHGKFDPTYLYGEGVLQLGEGFELAMAV